MNITPVTSAGRPLITVFGAGGFRFGLASGDLRIEGSVLVLADLPQAFRVLTLADLKREAIDPILALSGEVEFLLLGTGPKMNAPPPFLRAALRDKGLGLELMETAAACRAYNHLASEGRHFAALLLPVDIASA
jgi:uncharacterized protein